MIRIFTRLGILTVLGTAGLYMEAPSYLITLTHRVFAGARAAVSTDLKLDDTQRRIEDMGPTVSKLKHKVAAAEIQQERTLAEIGELEAALRGSLGLASTCASDGGFRPVAAAGLRGAALAHAQTLLDGKRALLERQRRNVDLYQSALTRAQTVRDRGLSRVEFLRARQANVEAAHASRVDLDGDGETVSSALAALDELEREIAIQERLLDLDEPYTRGGDVARFAVGAYTSAGRE